MEVLFLLLVSILPGILFLSYILYMDRNEPEPFLLVLKTMFWGGMFAIPAALVEVGLAEIFPIFAVKTESDFITAALQSFLQVALIEEVCKLAPVLLFVWKNPEFNEENDGIVYVGASALGFATLENIFYVLNSGWSVGILRSISSIPLHCFTGVIMGYFVGLAKFSNSKDEVWKKIFIGFVIAYLFHSFYDTFALSGTTLSLLLIPTVILLWLVGVKLLKKGRELSLVKWRNLDKTIDLNKMKAVESFKPTASNVISFQNEGKWKPWISRPILFFTIIFWLLLLIGIFEDKSRDFIEIILGGIILTFLPITVSVFLEISYFQSKRSLK